MNDSAQSQAAQQPANNPAPLLTIDGAFVSSIGSKLMSMFGTLLGYIIMGLTTGYTTGSVLKAGIADAVPQVPPIIKRLLPPAHKAEEAVGRILFGNSGCTASVIGPVYSNDQVVDLLTASHCVHLGQSGTFKMPSGASFPVKCVARDGSSDSAWLQGKRPEGPLPYLLLSPTPPRVGESIYHCGFGVDKPGNRELGKCTSSGGDSKSQCQYGLSVSSGDSGGPICSAETHHVYSPVCCTNRMAGYGTVWGASPLACSAIRPKR